MINLDIVSEFNTIHKRKKKIAGPFTISTQSSTHEKEHLEDIHPHVKQNKRENNSRALDYLFIAN